MASVKVQIDNRGGSEQGQNTGRSKGKRELSIDPFFGWWSGGISQSRVKQTPAKKRLTVRAWVSIQCSGSGDELCSPKLIRLQRVTSFWGRPLVVRESSQTRRFDDGPFIRLCRGFWRFFSTARADKELRERHCSLVYGEGVQGIQSSSAQAWCSPERTFAKSCYALLGCRTLYACSFPMLVSIRWRFFAFLFPEAGGKQPRLVKAQLLFGRDAALTAWLTMG